jgi:hypothetical protein
MAKRRTTTDDTGQGDTEGPGDEWVGPIEEGIRDDLAAMITPHPMADGLRAAAIRLAHLADRAGEIHVGSVMRELRAVSKELSTYSRRAEDQDLVDELSAVTPPPRPLTE